MQVFTTLTSALVPLARENVDTDQIIPARFLKVTDKAGLGEALFADWRYQPDGSPNRDFVLNQPDMTGKQMLLAGDNFGCGSSREHAPWALAAYGFRAIVSTSFADIFRNNALKNGLLPVVVDAATHAQLVSLVAEEPDTPLTVDLASQSLRLPDGRRVSFPMDSFSKRCLLEGLDPLGYLLAQEPAVHAFLAERPAWM